MISLPAHTTPKDRHAKSLTQPAFRDRHTKSSTDRLRRDDWWIAKTETLASQDDTETEVVADESRTAFEETTKKIRAIHRDSVNVSLEGDTKRLLQQWECVVLSTDDETVHCEMHDLTDESNPIEYAELLWSEFNDYDKPLLHEGAVFYWSIGHLRKKSGQVQRFSETRVRRMTKLSRSKQLEISRKVQTLNGLHGDKP